MARASTTHKPLPYTLDCEHIVWFKTAPDKHDVIWCVRCLRYEPLMLVATKGTHWDAKGEFMSEVQGRRVKGYCLFDGCLYSDMTYGGYEKLRTMLHSHYMRAHTNFGALVIKTGDRLPKNSPPPF